MRRAGAARCAGAFAIIAAGTVTSGCTFGGQPGPVASDGAVPKVAGIPDAALEVMNQPQFAHGRWLIAVQDLNSGKTLIDLDADTMAEPGSFVKTYSAGTVWLRWGPDHTTTTPVKQSGTVAGGTLTGDLVLVGQGDLTMGGRTKADGTVDFANLDHNDAHPLPGAWGFDAFNDRFRLVTKALSGVMDTKEGKHLAFTIMVNQGFYADPAGVFQANGDAGKSQPSSNSPTRECIKIGSLTYAQRRRRQRLCRFSASADRPACLGMRASRP